MSDKVQENASHSNRRDMQRRFEALRLGERSEAVAERSEAVAERSEAVAERSEAVAERSEAVAERGPYLDGSGPSNVAADIFRRAASLGGHLVIAFVAPVGACDSRSRQGLRARPSRLEAEAAAAQLVLRRLIEQAITAPPKQTRKKEPHIEPSVHTPVLG